MYWINYTYIITKSFVHSNNAFTYFSYRSWFHVTSLFIENHLLTWRRKTRQNIQFVQMCHQSGLCLREREREIVGVYFTYMEIRIHKNKVF